MSSTVPNRIHPWRKETTTTPSIHGERGIWFLTACTQEPSSRSRQRWGADSSGRKHTDGGRTPVVDWEATSEEEMRVQAVVLLLPAVDPAVRPVGAPPPVLLLGRRRWASDGDAAAAACCPQISISVGTHSRGGF